MTIFKDKVYQVVKMIPKGEVLSYKQVAELAGSPRAYRAVGNILNKNHDKSIPCHRVIKANGQFGGYNKGTNLKQEILVSEGYRKKIGK